MFHCASGNYDNRLEFSDHLFRDKYGDRMHSYFCKSVKKDHFIHSRRPIRLVETRRLGLVSAGFGIGCFMLLLLPNLVTLPAYFLATIDRSIDRSVDGPGDLRRYELPCIISFSATPSSLRMIMMP